MDDPSSDRYLGVHGREAKNEDSLELFSKETGGRLLTGSEIGELWLITLQIRKELKTQYRLGYVPTNKAADGKFQRVDIEMRRRGVVVHARRGDYAKKPKYGSEALLGGSQQEPKVPMIN